MTTERDETTRVAVASRSFSKHDVLRAELLARYAQVTFNDAGKSLAGDELVAFLRGHAKAIIALETIDDRVLSQLPDLKVISKYGVGLDSVDLDALTRRRVLLGWSPGVNARSVAELTLALAIIVLRNLRLANDEVRAGQWRQIPGNDLHGRVIGIVGLGHVGKLVATLFQAFGCEIMAHDIVEMRAYCAEHRILEVGLDELLARADVVSIHVPLDESTRHMFNARRLRLMRRGVVLINTARGGIVDESAVHELLQSGHIAGAAFDVFEREPPVNHELLRHPGFFASPHIGGSSREAVLAMGRAAIAGLDAAVEARTLARR